jgi:hypothetical protein
VSRPEPGVHGSGHVPSNAEIGSVRTCRHVLVAVSDTASKVRRFGGEG